MNAGPETCYPNGGIPQAGNCLSVSDCQHGLVCSNGICEPTCAVVESCPTNYVCSPQVFTDNGQSVMGGYSACDPHCNPVFPTTTDASHAGCGADQQCYLEQASTGSYTYCLNSTGSGGQGVPCTYAIDCLPGYSCITPSNRCEQLCRVGFTDCETGSCVAFAMPEYDTMGTYNQEIGACQ